MNVILQFPTPEHRDSQKRSSYEMCTERNDHLALKGCPTQSALGIDLGQLAIFLSRIPAVKMHNAGGTYSPLNMIAASSPCPDYCEDTEKSRDLHKVLLSCSIVELND